MAMQDIVKIHENDNVAVALRPLAKGETLDAVSYTHLDVYKRQIDGHSTT